MADLKLRSDAWSLARLVTAAGIDLGELKPGPDGWHSFASMVDSLAAIKARNEAQRERAAAAPSMDVETAYQTGRIHPASRAEWQSRFAADPHGVGRVLASLAPVVDASERAMPGTVWATGPDGHPVLAAGGYRPSSTPRLDALERALYGPDAEARDAEQRMAAERELADLEEADQVAANSGGLTDDEYRSLFPASGE